MSEKAQLAWALLEDQRRIIEDQRSIIEEQRRIIDQQIANRAKCTTPSHSTYSDTSSTAGSSSSIPTTSISSVCMQSPPDVKIEPPFGVLFEGLPDACSDSYLMDALMEEIQKHGGTTVDCDRISERSIGCTTQTTAADLEDEFAETPSHRGVDMMLNSILAQAPSGAYPSGIGHSNLSLTLSAGAAPCLPPMSPSAAASAPKLVHDQVLSITSSSLDKTQITPTSALASSMEVSGSILNRELWKLDLGSWALTANVSPRGRWLCTGSEDKTARIYDLVSKANMQCFPHDGWVWSTRFSPDGLLLCTGSADGHARVFDWEIGREIHRLEHGGVVRDTSFNAAGKLLLTACEDKLARLFDAESARLVRKFEHAGWVLGASWSPEGERCCTASDDRCARTFDVETGQQQHIFEHYGWARCANFSPDGNLLCTASDDKCVRIFDLNSRVQIHAFEHPAEVASASISPDGNWLCSACSDNQAYIFDLKKRMVLLRFEHDGRVRSADFSGDGRRLCTASEDGHVRVFGYALQSTLSAIRTTYSTSPPQECG